ncbi:SRPBCC family protein [Janibacter melonis]|uniref:SRPBCC family protein n=1 Tax=Janibacter melonis TaxID=262209 RepID=UPI001E413D0B|nr:SRPBCC family protein [Janibacter melonis]MCB5991487.1 SRPBCC family protein [Janibacter melonis]
MSEPTTETITLDVDAPAQRVYALLTDPAQHPSVDGSRMVRERLDGERLTQVGQVFSMQMRRRLPGRDAEDYVMDNHVVALVPDRVVAWRPGPQGGRPIGWEWRYELDPIDEHRTRVRQTFDWTDVPEHVVRDLGISMPALPTQVREESLRRLAAAVTR